MYLFINESCSYIVPSPLLFAFIISPLLFVFIIQNAFLRPLAQGIHTFSPLLWSLVVETRREACLLVFSFFFTVVIMTMLICVVIEPYVTDDRAMSAVASGGSTALSPILIFICDSQT